MLFNQKKLNILIGAALLLVAVCIIHGCHESYLDDHQVVAVGKTVRVRYGFYQDCKGIVLKPVNSDMVTDRQGLVHPSIFAGYDVDLTCNNEHTGDRFFTPDFLRVVR